MPPANELSSVSHSASGDAAGVEVEVEECAEVEGAEEEEAASSWPSSSWVSAGRRPQVSKLQYYMSEHGPQLRSVGRILRHRVVLGIRLPLP